MFIGNFQIVFQVIIFFAHSSIPHFQRQCQANENTCTCLPTAKLPYRMPILDVENQMHE